MQASWIPCSGRACHSSLRHVLVSFVSTSRIERDRERIPPLPPRGRSHPPLPPRRAAIEQPPTRMERKRGVRQGRMRDSSTRNGQKTKPEGGPTGGSDNARRGVRSTTIRILGADRFDFGICRKERFKPEGWRPPAPPSYRYSSRSHRYL